MTAPYTNHIDFISNYCDGWCQRCAFTTRCSSYAIKVAIEMCGGDAAAGLELALGPSPPMTVEEQKLLEEFMGTGELTEADLEEAKREVEIARERVDEHPLVTTSERARLPAEGWLRANRDRCANGSPALVEALAIIEWDHLFIHIKLRRALRGLNDAHLAILLDEDPEQNDSNGSAKLALISIRRTIESWEVVAQELQDEEARANAEAYRTLERDTLKAFPAAERFRRPGFDDP